jgi:beta-glucanase (GH16 family)
MWSDEFNGSNAELDKEWISQNAPSTHILCSRWRENALVSDGTLKLVNRKEKRGGQEWTSGNLWTKQKFLYGYFECRYRYAAAEGTNNSFWIMTMGEKPKAGKCFEIDINEGHYPNSINTNIHNWTDTLMVNGRKTHPSASKGFQFGAQPDHSITLELPVTTKKVRFVSNNKAQVHLGEFRIYNVNAAGYPQPLSTSADKDKPGLENFVRQASTQIKVSGFYTPTDTSTVKNLKDGDIKSRWTSQKEGEKWVEFEFPKERTIGCIQFLNGWNDKGEWKSLINDFKVQYHNGTDWTDIMVFDPNQGACNFARDFHTYGLEWTEKELVFYFDGKELRRSKNEFCLSPAPVWLSLAIIPWAGRITDAINGTQMEVDYVRIYQRK